MTMHRDDESTWADVEAPPRTAKASLGGRYVIQALLGAGGMGSVYLAQDSELGELVALKMLNDTGQSDLERFRDEVRLARRVTHQNVARIYDIGEHAGTRFLTMEYVDGESLAQRLRTVPRLRVHEVLRLASDLCSGLTVAHEAGVIHRDLKPANIMLAKSGRAVITDFGIATRRDSPNREVIGTPQYMAPEQYSGGQIDERTDVYALGGVLYRAATGKRPFEGRSVRAHAPDPCESLPSLPKELGRVVRACLSLDANARPASASAVQEQLAALSSSDEHHDAPLPFRVPHASDRTVRTLAVVLHSPAPQGIDDETFAAGLRDAIVERLGDHPLLRVTGRESGDAEATASLDVRRSETDVVVAIKLRGMREGLEFWSGSLQHPLERIIELSSAVARCILEVLALDVPKTRDQVPLPRELVETYLEARGLLRALARDKVMRAVALLEPIAAPSGHPLLLSALALAQVQSSQYRGGNVGLARAAVAAASTRAPREPETLRAEAALAWYDGEAVRPTRLLLEALDLAPGSTDVRVALARILLEAGVVSEGMRLLESVVARVPSHGAAWVEISRAHSRLGRFDRATAALDRAGDAMVAMVMFERMRQAAWRREPQEMEALDRQAEARGGDLGTRGLIGLVAEVGVRGVPPRTVAARIRADEPPGLSKRRQWLTCQLSAELAALGGDLRFALDNMTEAVELGLQDTLWLDRCPLFDDLFGHARFEQLRDAVRERARAVRQVLDKA